MADRAKSFVLRPLPVMYACAGCTEYGYAAPRVAQMLEARGLVQTIWLGALRPSDATTRFPLLSLDACGKACAREWVEARGGRLQCAVLLSPQERDDLEGAAARIAASL